MVEFNPLKVDIDPVFNSSTTPKPAEEKAVNLKPSPDAGLEIIHNPKPSIRTYKDDIQSAIQANHLSSINIAVAENEKMHSKIVGVEASPVSGSKAKALLTISLLLIIVGGGAIGVTYLIQNLKGVPIVQQQTLPSLITTEYKDELNTNTVVSSRFTSALSSRINDINIPPNNIYNVYITTGASSTKRLVTSQNFVTLSNFRMPDILKRSLNPDFMVGMYSLSENLPFVIFKTSSFENSYAGMIEWESALQSDFDILFSLNETKGGGLDAALTPSAVNKFQDITIVNKDVRILYDEQKRPILLYGIIDKDTIIITTNEDAFREIVSRLNKEKGLKR
jgi:hypothetical protein